MVEKKLYGTHGTCRTFADQIVKSKAFNLGHGRHGFGAYLWQADPQSWDYARNLAMAFADHNKKCFNQANDPSICWLKCELSVSEHRFYDLSCHEHNQIFRPYLSRYIKAESERQAALEKGKAQRQAVLEKDKAQQPLTKDELTKIYNGFFTMIKQLNGNEDIDVYFVMAESPYIKGNSSYYITTNKTDGCYVVRKNDLFISIERGQV